MMLVSCLQWEQWLQTGTNWEQAETARLQGTQWLWTAGVINDPANKEVERWVCL